MKILIVEDEAVLRLSLRAQLESRPADEAGGKHQIFLASTAEEALTIIDSEALDVAFLDIQLGPDHDAGIRLLKILRERSPATAVIMLTGVDDHKVIEDCLRSGASDYLFKPFDPRSAHHQLAKALIVNRLYRRAESLRAQAGDRGVQALELKSKSPSFQQVLKQAEKLRGKRLRILITGETGTGKEVMAQYLWSLEGDADRPFIPVHCGAISSELVESSLFGHTKGSFTGASADKRGFFEDAHGGDIFLDEIGTMPMDVQVKLLRTLNSGEVVRVGATRGKKFDFRVIAATNDDLDSAVAEKRFRDDLLYRIKEVELRLPPLRERKEDLPQLIESFLRGSGHAQKRFSKGALAACEHYEWPGNIRQLQKVCAVAAELSDETEIGTEEVTRLISRPLAGGSPAAAAQLPKETLFGLSRDEVRGRFQTAVEDLERAMIQFALETQKNDTQAAKFLGIPRNSLIRRISEWGWKK